jgi:ABC-2 type transport system permease protein
MQSFYAIYRKEMGHYFVSPVAYIFIGVFLFLSAWFFDNYLGLAIEQALRMEMQGMQFGMPPDIDLPARVMGAFFGVLAFLVLFFTPILTMGVYAEERKRGTMELLMTSPVTETQIVLAKFLASFSLFVLMLLPTASYLVFMFLHSDPVPPWRLLLAGYAGVLLLGGSLLALGTFISSLTENQLVAGVLTFASFLLLWVLDIGNSGGGSLGIGALLGYLSIIGHYEDFTRGVIDTSALIYYFSFMVLFIFLTVRSIDSMRWRRA